MAPGSIFYHISFQSTFICIFTFPIYIIKIPKIFILSYYLYQISLSQVAMKGLTTPLLCWLRVLCLFVWVRGTFEEPPTRLIPWFSKTEGNTYATIAASPFPLQGKPTQAQDVARRISGAVAGEVFAQVKTYQVPITNSSPLHLHYLLFASRFPLPHFTLAILFALFSVHPLFACFLCACVLDRLSRWLYLDLVIFTLKD